MTAENQDPMRLALDAAAAGLRLDRALALAVPTQSRERLKALIAAGAREHGWQTDLAGVAHIVGHEQNHERGVVQRNIGDGSIGRTGAVDTDAISLPALGPGLTWNWTPGNGTLSVIQSIATNPTNLTAVVNGSHLDLSWPADYTGWRLEVQTNSLGVGIATNWSTWPGSAATNAVSVPIDPANPTVFYRLAYP